MRYGLLSYSTDNIGDDIQSIATRGHLPRVDDLLDRDKLAQFQSPDGSRVKVICNGWFSHFPENWPPTPAVDPLLIAMHINQDMSTLGFSIADYFLNAENADYLRAYGPVGARDLATLKLLEQAKIPAYFSGCMTLTLRPKGLEKHDDLIVLVDVSDEVVAYVRRTTKKKVLLLSAFVADYDADRRLRQAQDLLDTIESAHCVITTRLHAALPSLALGTPVYLIDSAPDQYRFAGLNHFIRHGSESWLLDGKAIDIDHPEPNAEAHLEVVGALTRTVSAFLAATDREPPSIDLNAARLHAAIANVAVKERENDELRQKVAALEARLENVERERGKRGLAGLLKPGRT